MKLENVFRVRVIYKSGYAQDFDCTEFKITDDVATWKAVGPVSPLLMGIKNEVAAIWQLGVRKRFTFFNK
jgi:hypothetical protein